jgi:hypothetical protein
MKIKKISAVILATFLSGTVIAMPSFAADTTHPDKAAASQKAKSGHAADNKKYRHMMKEASSMMGHLGIANIALLHNMTDEATKNIQEALKVARKLEVQTAKLNMDLMKIGKVQYHSVTGELHDFWLPLVNDRFAVTNLDSEYLKSREPKAAEADAQAVSVKVMLDVKQVRDSLEAAAAAIRSKNYSDAQLALLNAQQSTFTDESVNELPLATAHDNLVLASQLVKSKDYDGASFALNHAKDALKAYQDTAEKNKSAMAGKLETDIATVQAKISQGEHKPSELAKIEKHIEGWMHKIEHMGKKTT